jgi:hypothetical protein
MPNEESFHAASGIISNSFFPQEIIAASSYNDLVSFEHNLAFGSHLVGSAACHLVSNNETLSRNADLTLREVAINE